MKNVFWNVSDGETTIGLITDEYYQRLKSDGLIEENDSMWSDFHGHFLYFLRANLIEKFDFVD